MSAIQGSARSYRLDLTSGMENPNKKLANKEPTSVFCTINKRWNTQKKKSDKLWMSTTFKMMGKVV